MSRQISPIRSALPFKMWKFTHTIRPNSIGGKNTSAPIYWHNHSSWIGKAALICGFSGGSPHVAYSKSQLDAPIYWRCKSKEQHFIPALPIRRDNAYIIKAVASGNGNRFFRGKRHVQNADTPRSPQSYTNAQRLLAYQPTLFFVTFYLKEKMTHPSSMVAFWWVYIMPVCNHYHTRQRESSGASMLSSIME